MIVFIWHWIDSRRAVLVLVALFSSCASRSSRLAFSVDIEQF